MVTGIDVCMLCVQSHWDFLIEKFLEYQLPTLLHSCVSHGGLLCTIPLMKKPPLDETLLKNVFNLLVLLSMLGMQWLLKSSLRTPSRLYTILVSMLPLNLCLHWRNTYGWWCCAHSHWLLATILLMGSILTSWCHLSILVIWLARLSSFLKNKVSKIAPRLSKSLRIMGSSLAMNLPSLNSSALSIMISLKR